MRFVWSGRYLRTRHQPRVVLFERPAPHNLRIKHLEPDYADKQVLINNSEDFEEFQTALSGTGLLLTRRRRRRARHR